MKHLKIWFIVVGIIYLLLGIGFTLPINEMKFDIMVPGFDAPAGSPAYRGFLDFTFMFGLDLIVIGGFSHLLFPPTSKAPEHCLAGHLA